VSWLGLTAFVMALVALVRTRKGGRLQARITRLEGQVAALQASARPERRDEGIAPRTEPEAPPAAVPPLVAAATPVAAPLRDVAPPPVVVSPAAHVAVPPLPPAPSAPRSALPALPRIDWERWIGVRGAAVLGGVVLALAGLYFFQYSIEHGLIPPWLRVLIGTAVGLGCVVGAELRARSRYAVLANGLVGGGIVVLYAAFWAASARYQLVGLGAGFVLMVSVTGACTALAHRHASLVIALIGLIGGFATPFLLSTGEDRPIALFSYILLLDACLLFVARQRGWPLLALVSLLGTVFYQGAWIVGRMEGHQIALAIGILAVFAAVFAAALRSTPAESRRSVLLTQGGAVLVPFAFALYLATNAELGPHFYPLGILLIALSASACWLARAQQQAWMGLGAAAFGAAVFAVWLLDASLHTALAFEAMALCVLLAGVFHAFVELDRQTPGAAGPAPAAMLSALGLHGVAIVAAVANPTAGLWPWLAGWLALTALSLRHGGFPGRERLQVGAAALLGFGWWLFRWWHGAGSDLRGFTAATAPVLAVALAGQFLAMLRRDPLARRSAEDAAAVFAWLLLVSFAPVVAMPALPALAVCALLGALVLLAGARAPAGRWLLAATALTAAVHSLWAFEEPLFASEPGAALRGFGIQLAAVAFFTAWPFLAFARLRDERFAWYASALAAPAWFLALRELYERAFGAASIGLLPIGLAAGLLAAAWQSARMRAASDPRRVSNLAWYLAASLGFLTVAIPLQLEKEWITIGWALEGLAVTLLWRRLDHVGLKYFALALLAGVAIRLVANEAVLGYYPRPSWRIVNWLLYTYLVPAAAMLAAARVLAVHEVSRARDFERPLYAGGHPVGAIGAAFAAAVVVFVWINLAIAECFAGGETLRLGFERTPARDLTTSIAWAVYALGLLAVGVRGRNRGARWLSLALMMVTVVKVFLYDLGELEDLYRVASLLGLAVSLILVSFAYQRFVVPLGERSSSEGGG
jgi:hypothetical protein